MNNESTFQQVSNLGCRFQIEGRFLNAAPYGSGHINETYASEYHTASGIRRYVHQKINHKVFKEPLKVMENILRVTRHIRAAVIDQGGDPERFCLNLIPTSEGDYYCQTEDGSFWRTYNLIEDAQTFDIPIYPEQVFFAAKSFGNFQALLANLPGERLHETIPNFHNTPLRFEAFLQAIQADPRHRVRDVKAEIDFILQRENDTRVVVEKMKDGIIPERVTHNDTKLNNVLIDSHTGEGICVIDLDTTMPGSALYDFGDMVRSSTVTAAEDEPDVEKVHLDLRLFEQIARGYLSATHQLLSSTEKLMLAFAGKLITLEQAIRFLTDYINGDIYYKTKHPRHNLDRARTQIKLVSEIELQMDKLDAIIDKYSKGEQGVSD
jgi:aminoglycoside phosphotransferase (APT) family kinase protein